MIKRKQFHRKVLLLVLLAIVHLSLRGNGISLEKEASDVFLIKTETEIFNLEQRISGKVIDQSGAPLPGVSIQIKGTSTGTTTDFDGNYSLTAPNSATTLVFSFMGYATQEVSIGGNAIINVTMVEEASTLDEVVVVGYGTVKRRDVTGAVSSVKGADLTQLPSQRADAALQGRASGVLVQNTDGEPGGNVTIRIRGGNSITGGNNALVVIDGVQGGNLSLINPNDIESLEVLKDASATAIYGARGANGVILVTTKKGVIGKPQFSYSLSSGIQSLNTKLDIMDAGNYASKSNDYAATLNGTVNSPITPVLPFTEAQISSLEVTGGTDWQEEIYRDGLLVNHQLSIGGGGENVKYFVSGSYMDQEGIVVNTGYERFTLRTNLDVNLTKWLNAGVYTNILKDQGNVPPSGEGTYYGDILGQVINTVVRFDPVTPVYDELGNYNYKALRGGPANNKGYADPDVWNPMATALETKSERNNLNTDASIYLDFLFSEALSLRISGSASFGNMDNTRYMGTETQPGYGTNGYGILEFEKGEYYQNSNVLTYKKTFNEKHRLTLTGVAEMQLSKSDFTNIEAQGFFSDDIGIKDLAGASQIMYRSNAFSEKAINSFLGRVNYVYADKYMFTASYRADGSSVFGENEKWGYFPSAAVAWKVSEEDFLKDSNVLSDLKFRASWGITGNQAIQPYQTLASVGSGFNYPYLGDGTTSTGYMLLNAASPDLKWEETEQIDFGLDIGFFNQRLTASADFYKKETTDLLLNAQLPAYTGFASIISNVGSVENKGMEFSLRGDPVSNDHFTWNTGASLSFNEDKVLSLASDAPLPIITNTGGGYNIYRAGQYALKNLVVGQPVDNMYGYVNLGTWSEAERSEALAYGQLPGDAKWKDVNGDGKIDKAGDGNEIIGNASPDFYWGWDNTFTLYNFKLSFLFIGSEGNDIFNAVRIKTETPNYGASSNLEDRWTIDNQDTDVPAFTDSQTRNSELSGHPSTIKIGVDNRSSRWVEDASYIRLKNITLGYDLPTTYLNKIHLSRLNFYVSGSNVFTSTDYTGYDPEVSSFNKGSRVRAGGLGIDLSNYPTAKTYLFGINLTF